MGNETNETKTIYSSQTFKNSSQLGETRESGYRLDLCEPASMCLGCWSRRECHHHACLPRWINILLFDRLELRLVFNEDSMQNVIFERFLKINQIALKELTSLTDSNQVWLEDLHYIALIFHQGHFGERKRMVVFHL